MSKQEKKIIEKNQEIIEKLLSKLGIQSGQKILDFGSGNGNYTIPASKLVKPNGIIIAIDESKQALSSLQQRAKQQNCNNILTIHNKKESTVPSHIKDFDFILAFDVLHYLEKKKRIELYKQFHHRLKTNGKIIIHPKHTKNNFPMWHLSSTSTHQLIQEIQQKSFQCTKHAIVSLVHDDQIEKGPILIFTKKS